MVWDEPEFRELYRGKLQRLDVSTMRHFRGQASSYATEVGRSGVVSGVHLAQRAGAAASSYLSGYVAGALAAFDEALKIVGAEPDEDDLESFRGELETEITRRTNALHQLLKDFDRRGEHASVLGAITAQAPTAARRNLAERLRDDRARIHSRRRKQDDLERAVFISHSAKDKALALALQGELREYLRPEVEIFVSSDLVSIRGGADWKDRLIPDSSGVVNDGPVRRFERARARRSHRVDGLFSLFEDSLSGHCGAPFDVRRHESLAGDVMDGTEAKWFRP